MPVFTKNVVAPVVALVVGLFAGYVGGREHVKYEIRTVFQNAAQQMENSIGAAFNVPPTQANEASLSASATASRLSVAEEKPAEAPSFHVALIKKDYIPANYRNGNYNDRITISVSFENLTGKDIRAYDGVVKFTDLLDNPIMQANIAINDPLKAGEILKWNGELDYNQFDDSDRRLRAADAENIKISFVPRKILFVDGTMKNYE